MATSTKVKPAPKTKSPASLDDVLAPLERAQRGDDLVVSCYLSLTPEDRTGKRYLRQLKSRVHELGPTVEATAASSTARQATMRDLGRVVDHCSHPSHLPRSQGLAIFASEPLDLFEVVTLPRVHRFQLVVDRTPYIRSLLSLQDEFGLIVVAAIDRARARIYEVTAFGVRESMDLTALSMRGGRYHSDRQGAPGWGEHTYHNRIRTEKERHYNAVCEYLRDLDREKRIRGFVIGGQGPTPGAVMPFLHPALVDRVLGKAKLNPTAVSPSAVYEAARALAAEHAAKQAAATATSLGEAIGTGYGVNGIKATLAALFRGQVRELMVVDGAFATGYRCSDSGRLVLTADECRREGAAVPVPYLIDEAIEEAVRQRVPVRFVSVEVGSNIDSMAGILRFR